jgi:hypothetical protein
MFKVRKWAGSAAATAMLALLGTTIASAPGQAAQTSAVCVGPCGAQTPTTFATQAVLTANGAVTILGGVEYLSNAYTTVAADSALLTFTLPSGVLFATTPTATLGGTFGSGTFSGGGAGANSVTYTITTPAATAVASNANTVTLNAFQITGASALQGKTIAGAFQVSAQMTGANTPGFSDAKADKTSLALSTSALVWNDTTFIPAAATINVLPPSNGTKINQATNGQTFFDAGTLSAGLATAFNAAASAQFTFTGTTLAVTVSGNFSGANNAYIAPPFTTSCATSFAGQPTGSLPGTISGNTATFSGVATGFDAVGFVNQELCIYYTGTTIIGQNPAAGNASATSLNGSMTAVAAVDTTTSPAIGMQTETYNGVVQQIQYSGNFQTYPEYIRIVNNNAAAIQVFAVVQSDSGSTGTATVETALAANSNDLVTASSILASSGVSLAPVGRASMILLGPFGSVFSQLMQQPQGLIVNIQ